MAEIPSVVDLFLAIMLVVPGFIAFLFSRWLAGGSWKLDTFEKSTLSLALTLFSYLLFAGFWGVSDLDSVRRIAISFQGVASVIVISVGLGIAIGLSIRFIIFRGLRRFGSVWDLAIEKFAQEGGGFVTVWTNKGEEIEGILDFAGTEENPRELLLRKPAKILRNANGEPLSEIALGEDILFTEGSIERIAFVKKLA